MSPTCPISSPLAYTGTLRSSGTWSSVSVSIGIPCPFPMINPFLVVCSGFCAHVSVAAPFSASSREGQRGPPSPEGEVQPVVGFVGGQPVHRPDQPDQEKHQVDRPAADQEVARALPRAREREARNSEDQMDEVVKDARLKHVQ